MLTKLLERLGEQKSRKRAIGFREFWKCKVTGRYQDFHKPFSAERLCQFTFCQHQTFIQQSIPIFKNVFQQLKSNQELSKKLSGLQQEKEALGEEYGQFLKQLDVHVR